MDTTTIILILIGICLCVLLFLLAKKPLQWLGKFILKSLIGIVCMAGSNLVLSSFGVGVGINLLTTCFVGLLGLPGLLSLIIMTFLF